jgi:hypothetical protein
MTSRVFIFLSLVLIFFSCESDTNKADLVPLDLMKYGAPFTIMAPDSIAVEVEDNLISKDLFIKFNKNYDVLVQIQDAADSNSERFIKEQEELVRSGRFFSKMVQTDEKGFVFENKVDSTYINYGFRYLVLQNEKEYIFQSGLYGNYDLESVKRMYQAVQQ